MRQVLAFHAEFGVRFAKLSASLAFAALLAGCSSDATRLSESFSNPFSNPFSGKSDVAAATPSAPTPQVSKTDLPTKTPPLASQPAVASAQPSQPVTFNGGGKWTVAGGSPVVVGAGDTASSLSERYGVPTSAILSANGYSSAAQIKPGARIVIPVYNGTGPAVAAKPTSEKVADSDAAPAKADLKKKKKKQEDVADASATDSSTPAKTPKPPHPAKTPAAAPVTTAAAPAPAPTKTVADAAPAKPVAKKKATDDDTDKQPTAALTPQGASTTDTTSAQADASGSNPEFRWPARGRIIQGFKAGANDGINISVPEGTSVRAAESGVVAYAGNDLKGYGNLVLIRHPNGFVTAYADNGELDVKRGETVKRGQIIAKSGETGNVNAPQLHFELRKNSQPVDPTEYLAGL